MLSFFSGEDRLVIEAQLSTGLMYINDLQKSGVSLHYRYSAYGLNQIRHSIAFLKLFAAICDI